MNNVRPFFVKLLLAGVIVFSVGITIMLTDMYVRICCLEHDAMHISIANMSSSCSMK